VVLACIERWEPVLRSTYALDPEAPLVTSASSTAAS
jgi:hypothetical protein